MRTLKEEEVDGIAYCDVVEARAKIRLFIETIYNRQRLHSALDYRTPEEYEQSWPRQRAGARPGPSRAYRALSLILVSHRWGEFGQFIIVLHELLSPYQARDVRLTTRRWHYK